MQPRPDVPEFVPANFNPNGPSPAGQRQPAEYVPSPLPPPPGMLGGASPGSMNGGDGLGGIWGGATSNPGNPGSVSTAQSGKTGDLGLGSLSLGDLGSGSMSTVDSGAGLDSGFTLSGFDALKSLNLDSGEVKDKQQGQGGSGGGLWGGGGGGGGGLGGGIW